jgi:hypothetical protein
VFYTVACPSARLSRLGSAITSRPRVCSVPTTGQLRSSARTGAASGHRHQRGAWRCGAQPGHLACRPLVARHWPRRREANPGCPRLLGLTD